MADIKKQIINKFNEAHNVAVFTHVRPDADAIGSCSALKMVLESQGKHVDLYCDSEISDRYNFIKFSDAFNKPTCTEYDLTVNLDCNGINRIGQYGDLFLSSHNTINIDHLIIPPIKKSFYSRASMLRCVSSGTYAASSSSSNSLT